MNNLYSPDDGKARLRKTFFAFLDILGFSEMIESADEQQSTQKIDRLLTAVESSVRYFKRNQFATLNSGMDWSYQFFSDSLVIAQPLPPNHSDDIGMHQLATFIEVVAAHQLSMAMEGLFVRGAISCNTLFMNKRLLFGKALLESHHAERNDAIYPRVIVCSSARPFLNEHLSCSGNGTLQPLLLDSDGQVFVNYLSAFTPDSETAMRSGLMTHKNVLLEALAHHQNTERVVAKYEWLAAYHNYFCQAFAREALNMQLARKDASSGKDALHYNNDDLQDLLIEGAQERHFLKDSSAPI